MMSDKNLRPDNSPAPRMSNVHCVKAGTQQATCTGVEEGSSWVMDVSIAPDGSSFIVAHAQRAG